MDAKTCEHEVSLTVSDGLYRGYFAVSDGLMTVTSAEGARQESVTNGFEGRLELLARTLLFELYLMRQAPRRLDR